MKLYRYIICYGNYEEETMVILREYPVIKETECFYFITSPTGHSKPKKIGKWSLRSFAHDTKEKAKANFIHRAESRIAWYRYWMRECEKGLKLIEDVDND